MKHKIKFLQSETAISFGYLVIAAFLIGGSALWIMLQPVFNQLFVSYNTNIADGTVTVQNQQAMEFHQKVLVIVPVVMLIGLAGWGFIRALEKRNEA